MTTKDLAERNMNTTKIFVFSVRQFYFLHFRNPWIAYVIEKHNQLSNSHTYQTRKNEMSEQ